MVNKNCVHSGYYQAVIQLRPASKKLVDFVLSAINKRRDVWVSKTVRLNTGVDIYVSDQRFARALGSKLKKSFRNGVLKMSRSLYGVDRMTSKNIYRVTVCFRTDK